MDDFKPIPVRSPREAVELQLREAILAGELSDGERLVSEPELARMFEVSRSTVREALRALAVDGLIERVPGAGGGTFIRAISAGQLADRLEESVELLVRVGRVTEADITTVRELLEVPAAELAAKNRTEEDLDELRSIIESEKSIDVDDPNVPGLDTRFHSTIARATGNGLLAALIAALHKAAHPVAHLHLTPEDGQMTVRQHMELVQSLADQDPRKAAQKAAKHINYLHERAQAEVRTESEA